MGEVGIMSVGGQQLEVGVSLGLCVLWLGVSKINAHIRGESRAPCKDLALKCLIKRAARGSSNLSQSLPHRSVAHFTLREQDVSL